MVVTAADMAGLADARGRALSLGIMIAGMIWLALIAWMMALRIPHPFHGYEIYDLHYLTILEGRLDLPPRTLRLEGFYTPDGTGYIYQGVAPLLTRFALGWVWSFERLPMSGVSIWFWAVLGTAGYQGALTGLARRGNIWERHRTMILFLCAGLWLAGPGLLLVSNQAFYHEPIAVSFGVTGLFVAIWVRLVRGRITLARAVVVLALLAAIAFHARPNVAVALYAGTAMTIFWGIWRHRSAFLLPAMLAGALLGAGVAGYLALNEARLGSAAGVDGGYERTYGVVFWAEEGPDSARRQAFQAHGRFNALRVLPNLALYITDLPANWPGLHTASDIVYNSYRSVTEPILGYIRVEPPRIGMLVVLPAWLYLSLIGLWALRRDPPMAALAVCLALSFGLTLAYGTVTLRYRFDLWPLLGVLALVGAVRALAPPASRRNMQVIFVLLCTGFVGSHLASYQYAGIFRDVETNWTRPWSYEYCAERARAIGFEGDDLARVCREPAMGGA